MREPEQAGLSRRESTAGAVEGVKMRLVVDVQPLAASCPHLLDELPHEE